MASDANVAALAQALAGRRCVAAPAAPGAVERPVLHSDGVVCA